MIGCPGLLSRLQGREFEVYSVRRDVSLLYNLPGKQLSKPIVLSPWEARTTLQHDEEQAKIASAKNCHADQAMLALRTSHK